MRVWSPPVSQSQTHRCSLPLSSPCRGVGQTLAEHGHHWFGTDISRAMLEVAEERDVEGDLALSDMGQGLPLRAAMFDGAVSISAVQVRASVHVCVCLCVCTGAHSFIRAVPKSERFGWI